MLKAHGLITVGSIKGRAIMKTFARKSLLWLFSLLFVVCSAFTVSAFTQKESVAADEAPAAQTFRLLEGASIRNGEDGVTGLRFAFSFNQAWLDNNNYDGSTWRMLIFPAENAGEGFAFNSQYGPDYYAHEDQLDAAIVDKPTTDKSTGYTYGSIVYDVETIKEKIKATTGLEATEEQIANVLNNLYAMDLTAVACVKVGDNWVYTNTYTTSMLKVATRIVTGETTAEDRADASHVEIAKQYLGDIDYARGYVMADTTAVVGYEAQAAEIARIAIGNDYLAAGDYTIEGNTISFSNEIVAKYAEAETNKGQYANVFVYGADNSVTILNVLFGVDEIIEDADEFVEIFVEGDYDATKFAASEYADDDKTYVLGADIDLADKGTLKNRIDKEYYQIGAGALSVFRGILDGFGYAVSNAKVECYQSSYYAAGLLGHLDGAIIKNIAFINMSQSGSSSWGILTNVSRDTLFENLYIHVNSTFGVSVGAFGTTTGTPEFKNVVAKIDRAADYVYTYSHGNYYSPIVGRFNTSANLGKTDNLIVISNGSPLAHQANGTAGKDNFWYGVNETEEWVELATKRVANNTYRYDYLSELMADYNAGTSVKANVDALIATGLFKIDVAGNLSWHSYTPTVTYEDKVIFDGSTGTLRVSSIPEEFSKVTVTGKTSKGAPITKELTLGNGVALVGNEYQFNINNADGTPYATNKYDSNLQELVFEFETADAFYKFANVVYYNEVIDTYDEMKAFAEYKNLDDDTLRDFNLYALGTDIEFTGSEAFSYKSTAFLYTNKYGFSGVFDGNGHYIKNFKPGAHGLFGGMHAQALSQYVERPIVVKNFALIDVKASQPVFASHAGYNPAASGDYIVFENIYITYADGVQANGLFNRIAGNQIFKFTNVIIDTTKSNSKYKLAKDNKAFGITADYVLDPTSAAVGCLLYQQNHSGYGGGGSVSATLFENSFTNVITIGATPLIKATYTIDASLFSHTANGDGTYTHTAAKTVLGGALAAGNGTADIPVATALKPGFEALAATNGGTALAGYICKSCYNGFSATAGTCACGATLSSSSDLWKEVGSYVWKPYDFTGFTATNNNAGAFKISGVTKYLTADTVSVDTIKVFTDTDMWKVVNGNLTWNTLYDVKFSEIADINLSTLDPKYGSATINPTVSVDGKEYAVTQIESNSDCIAIDGNKITAVAQGSAVVTLSYTFAGKAFTYSFNVNVSSDVVVDEAVDYEASSSLLKSTLVGNVTKVTVTAYDFAGNAITKVLTIDNGGIVDGKFTALTSYDATYGEVVGVPFADNAVSAFANSDYKGIRQQMKFVVETTEGTYTFNNVMYYTEVVETAAEFEDLMDWDYTATLYNRSYYKLGSDINAAGLEYARTGWSTAFNYPTSSAGGSYAGFQGRFDGAGHTISNFEPDTYGLFGGFVTLYDYWLNTPTQIVIENVAFENIGSGPVLARFAPVINTRNQFDRKAGKTTAQMEALTKFSNIYVSVAEGATMTGLVGGSSGHHNLGKLSVTMENILIDATKANVKLASANKAYYVKDAEGKIVNQFAGTNVADFQAGYALFNNWIVKTTYGALSDAEVVRFINEELHNVVILGNIPVALGRSKLAESGAKNNAVDHIDNGDGTYTHQAKAMLDTSDLYAYACNVATGDIPVITGVKANFQAALINNDGSDVAKTLNYICYVCGTPYNGWKQFCPNADCGANNNLNGGWVGNVWSSPAAYTFTVRDLTNFANPTTAEGAKEFVLQGVYKYYDGIINANEVNLEAFKAAGFWSVNADGALVWGA